MKVQNKLLYLIIIILIGIIVWLLTIPAPVINNDLVSNLKKENETYLLANDSLNEKISALNFKLTEIEALRQTDVNQIKTIPITKKIYLFKERYGTDTTALANAYEDIQICKTDLQACGYSTNTLNDIIVNHKALIENQATVIRNDSLIDVMRITDISQKATEIEHLKKRNKLFKGIGQVSTGLIVALTTFILITN